MNETTETVAEQATLNPEHWYCEVPAELLAKPDSLAAILHKEGVPATAIFCNSPSDTDLIDVMLRKRGFSTRKLVGHVPVSAALEAFRAVRNREADVLVVTDIAAREVPIQQLDLVINHSIQSDPEVYLHRLGHLEQGGHLRMVVSIVAPAELGHLHYLKKFVEYDIKPYALPAPEQMAGFKLEALLRRAPQEVLSANPTLQSLTDVVLKHERRSELLALLLHNTLNVMPTLQSEGGSRGGDSRQYRGDDRRSDDSRGGDRRGEDRRGRDRRSDDRRGGEDRRGGGYAPRPYADLDDDGAYGDRESSGHSGRNGDREGRDRDRRNREPMLPPIKDARLYVGNGPQSGLTSEELKKLLTERGGITEDQIKRINLRGIYGFVDVADEVAAQALDQLSDVSLKGGEKLMLKKAIVLSTPRPQPPSSDDTDEGQEPGMSVSGGDDWSDEEQGQEEDFS